MNLEKIAREALRYLFQEYQKAPTVVYSIDTVARRFKVDAVLLSDFMVENLWIRERWVYPNNSVSCRITIRGIEEINPSYVRHKLQQLIGTLGESGGSQSLMEILQYNIEEYSIALDMVKQLESLGLVKSDHPEGMIVVQLTDDGWKYYEKGTRTFFTMMAVA
jgi:hypothetical protein